MNNKFLTGLAASAALAVSGFANAGLVNVTETFSEFGSTSTDQNGFFWTFDGLSELPTNTATFIINWERMDFDGSGEFMDIFVEGDLLGRIGNNGNNTCSPTPNGSFFSDCIGSISFQFDIINLLNDSKLELTSTQSAVNSSGGLQNLSEFGFVSVNLQYEYSDVPEPSTLGIFALGLIGLASRKFKKA